MLHNKNVGMQMRVMEKFGTKLQGWKLRERKIRGWNMRKKVALV